MNSWNLLQGFLFLVLIMSTIATWIRLSRPPKDDPRLSRGLQMLQSKISILEDLSDRTDTQVNQLMILLEQKVKEIQEKILIADKSIQKIETSMSRSLDVAKIFQDKIPHQEIIERQNTIKYIKAAKLANEGKSANEIVDLVGLNHGEVDFIVKVNRDQLQFSEEALPDWAKEAIDPASASPSADEMDFASDTSAASEALPAATSTPQLSEIGERFRRALGEEASSTPVSSASVAKATSSVEIVAKTTQPAAAPQAPQATVKKVIFPRVDVTRNLG